MYLVNGMLNCVDSLIPSLLVVLRYKVITYYFCAHSNTWEKTNFVCNCIAEVICSNRYFELAWLFAS